MSEGQGFVLHPQAAQDITDIWESLLLDSGVLGFHGAHKSELIFKTIEK